MTLLGFLCSLLALALTANAQDLARLREDVKRGTRTTAHAGWWFNDDSQDQAQALQAALDSGAAKLIIDRRDTPWLVGTTLDIPSNLQVIFEEGAEIRAMKHGFKAPTACLLSIRNRQNITLAGKGFLTMNKEDYQNPALYKKAEWRHTLIVHHARNITIRDLTFQKSGGDGIYLNDVTDVLVDKVRCLDNHRQGLSVISAENLLVKDSAFAGTDGTAPMAGVDFEPNHPHERILNCVMENCTFTNNRGAGILFAFTRLTPQSKPLSIAIRNCLVDGNHWGILNETITTSAKGQIHLENCQVRHSTVTSFMAKGMAADAYGITLKNCILDQNGARLDAPVIMTAENILGPIGNLHVRDVTIKDSRPNPPLFSYLQWKLNALENLTGVLTHASGKTYDLEEAVTYSRQHPPASCSDLQPRDFIPLTAPVPPSHDLLPIMVRSPRTVTTFLQAATAGEAIQITVKTSPIGPRKAMTFKIYSPSGRLLAAPAFNPDKPDAPIRFTAAETGIHRICYQGTYGLQLLSSHRGNGFLTSRWTSFFSTKSPVRMYFLVPAGTRSVQVAAQGSHPREWLRLQLLDPSGTIRADQDRILAPTLVEALRSHPDQDEIWSLAIPAAVEDFSLSIRGNSIPVLSTSPQDVLEKH